MICCFAECGGVLCIQCELYKTPSPVSNRRGTCDTLSPQIDYDIIMISRRLSYDRKWEKRKESRQCVGIAVYQGAMQVTVVNLELGIAKGRRLQC